MPLESANYIADLTATNPIAGDVKGEGDDHLRLIKKVLKATFPNASGAWERLVAKSSTYTVVAADNSVMFSCASGMTLNLTAAATLGAGFGFGFFANGNILVIDPAGSELINGVTSISIPAGSWGFVYCTGTAFICLTNVTDNSVYTAALQDEAVTLAKLAPDTAPSDTTMLNGEQLGYRNIPQVSKTAGFTFDLSNGGRHIYYTGAADSAIIPADSSVAFPLGTTLTVVNNGSGDLTINAASVTLYQAGSTNTGNRTLATKGLATLFKTDVDVWFISGLGLT